ncbi:lamin tail domain-containing protein [Actinomadura vinacea]|uniref:Lamin tail domain-containing protein n=2 Tax=Actinomadura vinacea TaxID=115336 RepID=A0ABN3KDX6_9ACTN
MGAAAVIAAGGIGLTATPAKAASKLRILRVHYNSPGRDDGSAYSLNAEWILLHNTARTSQQLKGYRIRDRSGHTYTFGSFRLGGRRSVFVHTGRSWNHWSGVLPGLDGAALATNLPGLGRSAHRFWGRTWYVWNNNGDTAYLYYPGGRLADWCSWGNRGSYKNC